MRQIISTLLICYTGFLVKADIIPNPIRVKGIVAAHAVNIQMESEVVTVDLYKDSSFVACVFNMRNLDKAQDVEIGFPLINFYLWGDDTEFVNPKTKNSFEVMVKGNRINKVNIYIPQNLTSIISQSYSNQRYDLLRNYTNQNKPWYLWKVHFNKNEGLSIVVKYRLPCGSLKSNRFFNYLLSTGAAWAGPITNASVIVNLKDIPADQIIGVSPSKHLKRTRQKLIWNFTNLEPSLNEDIDIKYETVKSSYQAYLNKLPDIYVDDKKLLMSEPQNILSQKAADVVADINVLNKSAAHKNGAFIIYTKAYAFKRFKKKIKEINRSTWKAITKENVSTIMKNFQLDTNGIAVADDGFFRAITKTGALTFKKAEVKHSENNKKKITISF